MFVADFKLTLERSSFPPGAIYISKIDFDTPSSIAPTLQFQALPLADVGNPLAVEFDSNSGMVYWLDFDKQVICRAYLNGTHQQAVVSNLGGKKQTDRQHDRHHTKQHDRHHTRQTDNMKRKGKERGKCKRKEEGERK